MPAKYMEQLNARIADLEGQLSAASAALGTTPSELLTRIKDVLQQVVDARRNAHDMADEADRFTFAPHSCGVPPRSMQCIVADKRQK
jgi:hypothetical protein